MKKYLSGFLCGMVFVVLWCTNLKNGLLKKIEAERKRANRNDMLYHTMNSWLMLMQKGRTIAKYFEKYGYYNVAVYGMGDMGERLYDALYDTDIHVKYGIDKNAKNIFTTLKLYTPDQEFEEVDIIVVTAVGYFNDIETDLRKKVNCPIVSIDKVIDEVLQL